MIIVMKAGTPEAEIDRLDEDLRTNWGLIPEKIVGRYKVVMGLVGDTAELEPLQLREMSTWIEKCCAWKNPTNALLWSTAKEKPAKYRLLLL
jgi:3-deoxy-7-phosphoheptulonate synthase